MPYVTWKNVFIFILYCGSRMMDRDIGSRPLSHSSTGSRRNEADGP